MIISFVTERNALITIIKYVHIKTNVNIAKNWLGENKCENIGG